MDIHVCEKVYELVINCFIIKTYLLFIGEAQAIPKSVPHTLTREKRGVVTTWTYSGFVHHLNANRTDHWGSIPVKYP